MANIQLYKWLIYVQFKFTSKSDSLVVPFNLGHSTLALHTFFLSHSIPLFQAIPFCAFTFCQPESRVWEKQSKTVHLSFFLLFSFFPCLFCFLSSLFFFPSSLLPNLYLLDLNSVRPFFSMVYCFLSLYQLSLNLLNACSGEWDGFSPLTLSLFSFCH